MLEASNFNFGLSIIGDERSKKRFVKALTLQQVIKWIKVQNWDEYTKKQLIKRASKYPHNALEHFGNNIDRQVIDIHKERQAKEKEKNERRTKKEGENNDENTGQPS
jgi:hypothetical protein